MDGGDGPDRRRRRRQTGCHVFQPARGTPGTAPCPPGLARSAGLGQRRSAVTAGRSRVPSPPAARLPRPRPRLPLAGNNWKPGKSRRRRSSRGAESRGAASRYLGRAGCGRGPAASGQGEQPRRRPGGDLPLSPGRRRAPAGRASAQQSRTQAMPAGGSIAALPARRGGRRPGCPQPGRARGQPRSAPLRSAQRCPAPRRPRIRPAAAAAAVAAALPARSEAETPGGGGGIVLEAQGVRSEVRLIDRGAATRRSRAAGSGDGPRAAGTGPPAPPGAPAPPPPRSGQPRPAAPAPRPPRSGTGPPPGRELAGRVCRRKETPRVPGQRPDIAGPAGSAVPAVHP